MTLLRILLHLLGLRKRRTVHLNPRVRVILPAPKPWRHHPMDGINHVLALAGATVARVTLKPTHDDGSAGKLDGPPAFVSSGPCTVVQGIDPLTVDIVATGEIGLGDVSISADGDLGAGLLNITDVVHFSFEAVPEPITNHLNPGVEILFPAPPFTDTVPNNVADATA
jgi:hypothetical protein